MGGPTARRPPMSQSSATAHSTHEGRSSRRANCASNDRPASPSPADGAIEPALMSARDVAAFLRVGVRTVWKLRSMGHLPSVGILGARRFRREDVERLVREGVRAQPRV